jgi:hypothetical protein
MAMLPILTPIEHIGEPLSLARQLPLQCRYWHQKPLTDLDCGNLAPVGRLISLVDADAQHLRRFPDAERGPFRLVIIFHLNHLSKPVQTLIPPPYR